MMAGHPDTSVHSVEHVLLLTLGRDHRCGGASDGESRLAPHSHHERLEPDGDAAGRSQHAIFDVDALRFLTGSIDALCLSCCSSWS